MSDDQVVALRPWRERKPGELRIEKNTETVREELPEGYLERLAALESKMAELEDAQKSVGIRVAEIERRPHLTADDVSNLGNAADARAKRAIEDQILPMIESLRAQVNATANAPAAAVAVPPSRTEYLSTVIESMIPVVKGLETEGERMTAAQERIWAEVKRIRDSMEQMQTDQLEMIVASIRDQRRLISQQASAIQVGNDG